MALLLIQFDCQQWSLIAMMGPRQEAQSALFYDFSIEDHVPKDHILRTVDAVIDLSTIRTHLADFIVQQADHQLIRS